MRGAAYTKGKKSATGEAGITRLLTIERHLPRLPEPGRLSGGNRMKFVRTMAVLGPAHFALWWLTYFILLIFDFDVLGSSQSPIILNFIHRLNHCLMFPLLLDPMRRAIQHWPLFPGVAIASCIWASCLSMAIGGCQRKHHVYAA
jgi:hypothetical protein